MKKTVWIIALILLGSSAIAQDVITTKTGLQIDCRITKQDTANVYFIFEKDGEYLDTSLKHDQILSCEYGVKKTDSNKAAHSDKAPATKSNTAMTIGLGQGVSVLGISLEILTTDRIGVQAGGGLGGFDVGLNFHLRPGIRSSYLSLQYLNTVGIAQCVGPFYVYRGKRWFTAAVGVGFILNKGINYPTDAAYNNINSSLFLSIGGYFPL